jgi:Na+-driven multidrug efflux pump
MVLGKPLIGLNVVTSILFQALGKDRPAFLLSISRQLLFLIPAVIIFLVYTIWMESGQLFRFRIYLHLSFPNLCFSGYTGVSKNVRLLQKSQ